MNVLQHLEPMLRGRRLLIFDFDGTLADTTELHSAAFAQVFEPIGIHVDYGTIAGMKTSDATRKCLLAAGRQVCDTQVSQLTAAKQAAVRRMISVGLEPLPWVDAFLNWARPRYRLAVGTSGSHQTVRAALKKLGYADWFDPVVCGDQVAAGKPAPDIFDAILRATGIPANDALVFEDSLPGLQAARAAGIAAVDVTTFATTRI